MIRRKTPLRRSGIKRKPPKKKRAKSELVAFKKKLWTKFAKWIKDTKGSVCFTTGRVVRGRNLHAGHCFSAGRYPALRWDPRNVWPQSAYANIYLKGDYVEFHKKLIEKIGQAEYDEMFARRNDVKQWRIEDLREIDRMIDEDYARRENAQSNS